jgi:cytochrome c
LISIKLGRPTDLIWVNLVRIGVWYTSDAECIGEVMFPKCGIIAFLFLAIATRQAMAEPSLLETGRLIAQANCQRCHSIERTGDSPFVEAPPFRDIARIYDVSGIEEALVEGIVVGHPAMPEFQMTGEQAAAITAYIESLSH